MTPFQALKRGGHKHPDQILEDLDRAGFRILTIAEVNSSVLEEKEKELALLREKIEALQDTFNALENEVEGLQQ